MIGDYNGRCVVHSNGQRFGSFRLVLTHGIGDYQGRCMVHSDGQRFSPFRSVPTHGIGDYQGRCVVHSDGHDAHHMPKNICIYDYIPI